VEVRDVSRVDAPSVLLAQVERDRVPVGPGVAVPFVLDAPEVAASRSLALRVRVDMQPRARPFSGDYLSTVLVPVPVAGDASDLVVPLRAIAD